MNHYWQQMNKNTGFWFGTYGRDLYQVNTFFHDISFVKLKGGCDEDQQETYVKDG